MTAKLYSLSLSHPGHAARLMLEHKGIEHRVLDLPPGFHPLALRALGFRRGTVPALRIDGRRVQGSLTISRLLDELRPEPPLHPSPAVDEAERWGERALQPLPRRAFRWGAVHDAPLRRWIAGEVEQFPLPGVVATVTIPAARVMARVSGASAENVRRDLAALPGLLDRVDALIAEGTLGRAAPNAADFQIGTTVRVLLAFSDLRPLVEHRPAADLATRVLPDYPTVPAFLPPGWLAS